MSTNIDAPMVPSNNDDTAVASTSASASATATSTATATTGATATAPASATATASASDMDIDGDMADKAASDDAVNMEHKKIFSTQEFMNFVKKLDLSKLIVETKDGHKYSASFNESFRSPSLDIGPFFKSLDSTGGNDSMDSKTVEATASLDIHNDESAASTTACKKGGSEATSRGSNPFESKEWAAEYAKSHVEVSYSSCFGDKLPPAVVESGGDRRSAAMAPWSDFGHVASAAAAGTSLPPKKRGGREAGGPGSGKTDWDAMYKDAVKPPMVGRDGREAGGSGSGKTDWDAMYNDALKPLVEAAIRAQKEQPTETGAVGGPLNTTPPTPKSAGQSSSGGNIKKKRKPRKVVPEVKQYVEFNDLDVLFGRGGRSNHHVGNKLYREIVTDMQEHYRACDKNEKTKVAQGIVDRVHHEIGGRFLELDTPSGKWFLVDNVVARRKVGQALRENNTEEARAAKRAKYQGGKANKKESVSTGNATEGSISHAVATVQSV